MNLLKKTLCIVLALVMSISLCLPAAASKDDTAASDNNITGPKDYIQMLWEEGYPAISTDQFMGIIGTFGKIISRITGKETETQTFNITLDKLMTDISVYVCEKTGVDAQAILSKVPDINKPVDFIVNTFNIDTVAFREQMYEKRVQYDAEGNSTMARLCLFLGVYLSTIEHCEIIALETEDPIVYEVAMRFTFKDGEQATVGTGLLINTQTGECYDNDGTGMLGIGFNFNLSQMISYATVNCWMRDFGFCLLYDVLATSVPAIFNYRTLRFKFDYDGYEWMIQTWKGNYLVANGGEVGLYCRTPEKFGTFYECASDEQLLEMTMQIYRGDKLLVDKPAEKHWWMNGFNISGRMYLPESLTMKFSIVMPDEEMLRAFCEAMDNHYKQAVTYTVDGLTVNVVW